MLKLTLLTNHGAGSSNAAVKIGSSFSMDKFTQPTLIDEEPKLIYRQVPLPPSLLVKLDDVHHVKDFQASRIKSDGNQPIWSFGRTTAWRTITSVMAEAGIEGIQATPKGLRHSFVIQHQALGTPVHMIQNWAGWASSAMMEVYGRALGNEAHQLASKLWKG
jgi:integrase/recombinase XerD